MTRRETLGKILKKNLADTQPGKPRRDDAQHQRNLIVVQRFYAELKESIVGQINKGEPVRPVKISATGANHDVFWIFHLPRKKPVALDAEDRVFRPQWDAFMNWAIDNDLRVELFYHVDAKSEQDYWFEIRIEPDL